MRHTSIIEVAQPVIAAAKKHPSVSKIVIGHIKVIESGPPRIKILPVEAGFKMTIRGRRGRQLFYVYCKDVSEVEKTMLNAWPFDVTKSID